MAGHHQVSFIDAEVKKWLEEAPEKGLCLSRFRADMTVTGLSEMEADHQFETGGLRYLITEAGKRCFPECELFIESGKPCPLAGGVAFGKCLGPSADQWLAEAKAHESAPKVGMYLVHNGVVRETARAKVREGDDSANVVAMEFSYDEDKLEEAVADTYKLPGIYYIKTWLNHGRLNVGDDIMCVLIGGDIRPNVTAALDYLVGRIKEQCVTETEIFDGR